MTSTLDATLAEPPPRAAVGPAAQLVMQWRPSQPVRTAGVVGLGYVGLPTALAWPRRGRQSLVATSVSLGWRQSRLGKSVCGTDYIRLGTYLGSNQLTLTTEAALGGAATVLVCVLPPVNPHLVPPPFHRWLPLVSP